MATKSVPRGPATSLSALGARWSAAWHWLRRHDVAWSVNADPPVCDGDIVCETCGLVIWCRAQNTVVRLPHQPMPVSASVPVAPEAAALSERQRARSGRTKAVIARFKDNHRVQAPACAERPGSMSYRALIDGAHVFVCCLDCQYRETLESLRLQIGHVEPESS